MPIQGYNAVLETNTPTITNTPSQTCSILLDMTTGSDVLIVRMTETSVVTGTPVENQVYIQANNREVNILFGGDDAVIPTNSADDDDTTNLVKSPGKGDGVIADTQKYNVHVYFVAPCSISSASNGVCHGGDDIIHVLKRLELTDDGSGNTIMGLVPLVEGIEFFKVKYGLDSALTTVNATTDMR